MLHKISAIRAMLLALAFLLCLPLAAAPGEDTLSKQERERLEATLTPSIVSG